ncbi:aldo/keto reductase [bacterium]|nr:aldo/keto reductase [bacterium]
MKRREFIRNVGLSAAAAAAASALPGCVGAPGARTAPASAAASAAQAVVLPRRRLGRTGLDVSLLGLGGFHQLEISQEIVDEVVRRYVAAGGNYVETAKYYGNGASETKLGRALRACNATVILASKTPARTSADAWRDLNESLERLGVDHLDLYFFHNCSSLEQLDALCAPGGALEAFQRARDEKLIGHMALSSHWPPMYVEAARRLPIEAVLIWGNYLDFCNYPEIPAVVLPALREKDIGILFMKPFADGFLHKSVRPALRYALAQGPHCIVAGFNSAAMLESDAAVLRDTTPVTDHEVNAILRRAPELGEYVCRQCRACTVCDEQDMLKRVFELEGKFDRQMDDRRVKDAAEYALSMQLKGWFNGGQRAREDYAKMDSPATALLGKPLRPCCYGIDIRRKLRIAHAKLTPGERIETL